MAAAADGHDEPNGHDEGLQHDLIALLTRALGAAPLIAACDGPANGKTKA